MGDNLLMPGVGTQNPLLSIMILTRNRKADILRSLQSCIECSLPPGTEFVIVDNASQDGTKESVEQFFKQYPIDYRYYYLPENIGCAAGRNVGLRKSRGRYIFFLDDDAYVSGPKEDFFQKMISAFNEDESAFSITTSLFDTKLNSNRPCIPVKEKNSDNFHKVLTFHGGSSVVDKERLFDREKLFYDYQFRGMAELYPSLKSYFNGFHILEMDDVQVIHEPSETQFFDKKSQIIYHYSGSVHVKLSFYPRITHPILYIMFCLRIIKHLGFKGLPMALKKLGLINKKLEKETVSLTKFLLLLREFGFIAIF